MNAPKVSIIIINWNRLKDTLECLESVKKSDYSNYEIIVLDNDSLGQEADIIKREFPEVLLIKSDFNLGFAEGNNLGIKRALENGAQYVWLLNNDAVVSPNTLSELVRVGEGHPEIGLLTPAVYFYSVPDRIQCCGSYMDWKNFRLALLKDGVDERRKNKPGLILWGTALLIKREVIEKIGYLNERFFAYYEDSDYSLRALKNGFINEAVFGARILHKSSIDYPKNTSAHHWFYMARNEYWFWKENIPASLNFHFLRAYVAKNLRRIGSLKENADYENMAACLDGIYCAFRNIGGQWDKNIKMPGLIKKAAFWHPYFLADLLEGNFKKIVTDLTKKIKAKTHKPCPKSAL